MGLTGAELIHFQDSLRFVEVGFDGKIQQLCGDVFIRGASLGM
jgi:hypothetical protein